MDHLGVVLQVNKEHKLIVMYNKCGFWLRYVTFLCHIISSEGVEVNTKKTKMVNNLPRPLAPIDI